MSPVVGILSHSNRYSLNHSLTFEFSLFFSNMKRTLLLLALVVGMAVAEEQEEGRADGKDTTPCPVSPFLPLYPSVFLCL